MSYQLPLNEEDLHAITALVERMIEHGAIRASAPEVETITRLVAAYRVHQRNLTARLAYLEQHKIGYFTDEILVEARRRAQEILVRAVTDPQAAGGIQLARIVLGEPLEKEPS